MAELGADVEALEELARKFDRAATDIASTMARLDLDVNEIWWRGRDADAFRSMWESTFKPQLNNVAKELHNTQFQIYREVEEQRQASGG